MLKKNKIKKIPTYPTYFFSNMLPWTHIIFYLALFGITAQVGQPSEYFAISPWKICFGYSMESSQQFKPVPTSKKGHNIICFRGEIQKKKKKKKNQQFSVVKIIFSIFSITITGVDFILTILLATWQLLWNFFPSSPDYKLQTAEHNITDQNISVSIL